MFKDAFVGDRILVPATAIYEWQEQPDRSKKKYELWFDEPVFAMAGLARDCRVKDEEKRCGVILTTRANHVFTEIHNTSPRQPVVVHRRDFDKWLDPATPVEELKRIMEPVADEETHFAAVPEPPSAQASLFQ
jgi:putative SOS response-associated peptidase YedK